LLSGWADRASKERPELAVAWLTLDDGDNDPARFLAYLVAALQCAHPAIADAVRPAAVLAPWDAEEQARALLTRLINDMTGCDVRVALVLDDYHLIAAEPIHSAVSFLIDHLPANMHLVVATRGDPPLPLARLRGRGQLAELRQGDLRFTSVEAAAFLNQAMALQLASHDLAALLSRTEGWIAGLQMAAVALRAATSAQLSHLDPRHGPSSASQFIQAFAGSNRYILDYLVEEVLGRQPPEIQTFLLHTSVLDRLSGSLCDALLERASGSQETLETLERANLFIAPLDERRDWYRYHRLFADLLRRRLGQLYPECIPALHTRASTWCEQHGQIDQAIEHALAGEDTQRAAHLIERTAGQALMRSEAVTLRRWIERLPDERVRTSKSLPLYQAWAAVLSGQPIDAIESRLGMLEGETDLILGQVTTMRAFLATFVGHLPQALALSREALAQLPPDAAFPRGMAQWISAFSQLADGDISGGVQALEEIAQASQETGNLMIASSAIMMIGRVRMREGHLREAKTLLERAIEVGTDRQGRLLPVVGRTLISLGDLLREWNDLEGAERYVRQGIELTEQWRGIAALPGYIDLAFILQARGNTDGAARAIQTAMQVAIAFDATKWDDLLVAMYQARLRVAQGDLDAGAQWVEREWPQAQARAFDRDEGPYIEQHLRKYEWPIEARLRIRQGRAQQALPLLDKLLSAVSTQDRRSSLIEGHVLRALALQAMGKSGDALGSLERALTLAEPGGYVRIFLDEGLPMRELLRMAKARGIALTYVNTLLSAFIEDQDGMPTADQAALYEHSYLEPLTDRELEVLGLVAEGLTNKQVADTLILAVGTVKKHLKNVYDKLDVHSRTQAVARARDLGIL
jgi:LuxR family maltose regulon positive regulatory protein